MKRTLLFVGGGTIAAVILSVVLLPYLMAIIFFGSWGYKDMQAVATFTCDNYNRMSVIQTLRDAGFAIGGADGKYIYYKMEGSRAMRGSIEDNCIINGEISYPSAILVPSSWFGTSKAKKIVIGELQKMADILKKEKDISLLSIEITGVTGPSMD